MMLSPDFLKILVCPRCKGELRTEADPEALVCAACLLRYPVRDGIPVMLVDEAENVGEK